TRARGDAARARAAARGEGLRAAALDQRRLAAHLRLETGRELRRLQEAQAVRVGHRRADGEVVPGARAPAGVALRRRRAHGTADGIDRGPARDAARGALAAVV